MPSAKTKPEEFVPNLTAFAVLKAPGGFVAYKLTIKPVGPVLRHELCHPCHKSLAYQYLIAHMNKQLVEDMVQDAAQTGQKQSNDRG